MIYLDELIVSLNDDNLNLKKQKEDFLNTFLEINVNDNIINFLNEDLINYFMNNINNYNLSKEELTSINKSINYFRSIRNLGIDLNNLYIKDKQLLSLKRNIELLYKKSLEYRDLICFNIDSQINSNNDLLNVIFKLKELIINDEIDIIEIQGLISMLPLKEKQKYDLLGEIYNQYIINLKSKEQDIERDATELLGKIRVETKPSDEIERKIEEEGIKLEITDEDRELQDLIQSLLFNIKKLDDKFPTDIYNYSNDLNVQKENELLVKDRTKLSTLLDKVEELSKKYEEYLNDKDIIWENDVSKDELELEVKAIYQGILDEYIKYKNIYKRILKNYKRRMKGTFSETEIDDESNQLEQYPPIIFWFGNNQIVNEDNYEKVDEFLKEFDSYPEDAFYSSDFLPALNLLKQQSSFIKFKEQGIYINTVDEVEGVRNAIPFKEVKMRNGRGGGTARIYYDTFKTSQGKIYTIIYLVHNKTDAYDKEAYQLIESYLKSKTYQEKLKTALDDQKIIDKLKQVEEYVYKKVMQRVDRETNLINNISDQNITSTIGNGGTK